MNCATVAPPKREICPVANNQWLSRLLAGTRGRIVAQLRRAPATIGELTAQLALSPNAVRSHLAALERDGIVGVEVVPRQGVGKPAHRYRLTTEAASLTPKAYDAMLDVVLSTARERSGAQGYAQLLKSIAAKLAGPEPAAKASFAARLAETRALLASLGAEVDVRRAGRKVRLVGSDCPLSAAVAGHPELCGVLADVIARRVGVSVNECCDRSAALPRCCFELLADGA
jgi:predicted ArsR family transcriptional regulator